VSAGWPGPGAAPLLAVDLVEPASLEVSMSWISEELAELDSELARQRERSPWAHLVMEATGRCYAEVGRRHGYTSREALLLDRENERMADVIDRGEDIPEDEAVQLLSGLAP
jgi:hypothetical protein